MSIEAKTSLLKMVEKQLSKEIPAYDLGKVLSSISDQLSGFDVSQKADDNSQPDDLLGAYASAMTIQGRSKNTVDRYKYIISRFMKSVNIPTRNLTVYHLRTYLAKEKERGISDSTLEGTRQFFSAYFNWLHREGLIDSNPTANLGTIKCQKKMKVTYSDTDFEQIKFCCKSLRDRAMISFLMSTGCRVSEMTQLNRSDVDLRSLECTVLGKGNKERTVYLDSVAGMWLKEYLDTRTDTLPALFIGRGSERITPQGVRFMMKQLQKSTSVAHIHPHKFRRTLATNLIRHGMPIQEVAAILGHDKLDTTMKYVVLDKSEIKHAYNKYV